MPECFAGKRASSHFRLWLFTDGFGTSDLKKAKVLLDEFVA
jgi:hypothetical protein